MLLFAESVDRQAKEKSLLTDSSKNFALLRNLTKNSLKAAQNSGLDVVHFDERKQEGATFGARITSSIQYVFDLGYDHVIVIGSDCPDLRARDIRHIAAQLERGGVVLGPDYHGGVYALGLARSSFEASLFQSLPWQTGSLKSSLVEYAKRSNTLIFWLNKKADLNHIEDTEALLSFSHALRSILERLENSLVRLLDRERITPQPLSNLAIDSRGP